VDDPFEFRWGLDQDGYELKVVEYSGIGSLGGALSDEWNFEPVPLSTHYVVAGNGGPIRYYRPLEEEGLWLHFAETCRSPEGALRFANKYGGLRCNSDQREEFRFPPTPLVEFLYVAEQLWEIAERITEGNRLSAVEVFYRSAGSLPSMRVSLVECPKRPGEFEYRFVPNSFKDALIFQAAESIAGNRRFHRCRNDECSNWFRLGPHNTRIGKRTYTARREFCSDRCRVASARRQKRGAIANA
jgi:hypothetical protein